MLGFGKNQFNSENGRNLRIQRYPKTKKLLIYLLILEVFCNFANRL